MKSTLLCNKWNNNNNNKSKVQLYHLQFTSYVCVEVSFWVEEQGCAGKISNFHLEQCTKKKNCNLIKGVISLPFSNQYLLPDMGKL